MAIILQNFTPTYVGINQATDIIAYIQLEYVDGVSYENISALSIKINNYSWQTLVFNSNYTIVADSQAFPQYANVVKITIKSLTGLNVGATNTINYSISIQNYTYQKNPDMVEFNHSTYGFVAVTTTGGQEPYTNLIPDNFKENYMAVKNNIGTANAVYSDIYPINEYDTRISAINGLSIQYPAIKDWYANVNGIDYYYYYYDLGTYTTVPGVGGSYVLTNTTYKQGEFYCVTHPGMFYFDGKTSGGYSAGSTWEVSKGLQSLLINFYQFNDHATKYKRWKNQYSLETACTAFPSKPTSGAIYLTATHINNAYKYLGQTTNYQTDDFVSAEMFRGLEAIVNSG